MGTIGMYMAIAGVASIVLHFLGMNLAILVWIDMWGPTMGWVIRIGLIVVGVLLLIAGGRGEEVPNQQTESDS